MAYSAGFIPLTKLKTVAPNTRLLSSTGQAFLNLALMYKMIDGTRVTPAGYYGSGYRDWSLAFDFYKAGQGDMRLRSKLGIDPNLRVAIAFPPGSHGGATRIDMLFNGHSPNEANLSFAERYGFEREFGSNDKNHFAHDQKTAINGVRSFDKLRLLGRYYNALHIGRQTAASRTGQWDADLIWLAQAYNRKAGTYPPPLKVDGVNGPNTTRVIEHDWQALKNAA